MDAFEEALKMAQIVHRRKILDDFSRVITETAIADAKQREKNKIKETEAGNSNS